MNKAEEIAYIEGRRAMATQLLSLAISELGGEKELQLAELLLEREQAIATLRDACRDHGDNDWPESLNLSDIIEKHLVKHL